MLCILGDVGRSSTAGPNALRLGIHHGVGQAGGPLSYQLVPTAAKGPSHSQGRSEPASGALGTAELTENGAVEPATLESGPRKVALFCPATASSWLRDTVRRRAGVP
jgi:hypothetical protein